MGLAPRRRRANVRVYRAGDRDCLSKFSVNDTPLDERFECLDYHWNCWKERDSFKRGYADGVSGLEELDYLKSS